MNSLRRNLISSISRELEDIKSRLETLKDEEQEYYDNVPENLQGSERYEQAGEAGDNLDSAFSSLEESIEYLSSVIEN
jgi:predicted  nucleic acid-binding Zn-ribbon protein